jgi:quercetin dioxygenase-like cupin family protein
MTRLVEPGLTRNVLAQGARLMLVEHRMATGWHGARHSHPHEQLVFVLSGHIRVSCGEQEPFEAKTGDSFVVPGDVSHQVSALVDSCVLDVFTPIREDY